MTIYGSSNSVRLQTIHKSSGGYSSPPIPENNWIEYPITAGHTLTVNSQEEYYADSPLEIGGAVAGELSINEY